MAKFVAIKNNFGYAGTYWHKGDIIEAAAAPNEHFAPYAEMNEADRAIAAKKEEVKRKTRAAKSAGRNVEDVT